MNGRIVEMVFENRNRFCYGLRECLQRCNKCQHCRWLRHSRHFREGHVSVMSMSVAESGEGTRKVERGGPHLGLVEA